MSHTILLVQPGRNPETRTYSDYESVNECMEGVCKIYEEHLKRRNPNTPTITYDISQLFDFVDQVRIFCGEGCWVYVTFMWGGRQFTKWFLVPIHQSRITETLKQQHRINLECTSTHVIAAPSFAISSVFLYQYKVLA